MIKTALDRTYEVPQEQRDWVKCKEEYTPEVVKVMSDYTNSSLQDFPRFCELMSQEHRYLQNEFTLFCLRWLEHCAKPNYGTDARNLYSARIGKKVSEVLNTGDY